MSKSTVLILGASGMLGNAVMRLFAHSPEYSVVGSVRSSAAMALLPREVHDRIVCGVNVEDSDALVQLFAAVRPALVVNCIGVVKQLAAADDPLVSIPINSLLPHRLSRLCRLAGARLVHVSTDCVFSGTKGGYREDDPSDAQDLYGRSKFLGEVADPHTVTLRTSIIGPELNTTHGLVGWFLSQRDRVKGYRRAIFSGLPTVELASVIRDFVVPRPAMHGVYHVAAEPISKFELLSLIARVYEKSIHIEPDDRLVIDRSLNATRLRNMTGYAAPNWPQLVRTMREFG